MQGESLEGALYLSRLQDDRPRVSPEQLKSTDAS